MAIGFLLMLQEETQFNHIFIKWDFFNNNMTVIH